MNILVGDSIYFLAWKLPIGRTPVFMDKYEMRKCQPCIGRIPTAPRFEQEYSFAAKISRPA